MSILKKLPNEGVIGVPPPPQRFTLDEWHLNNRQRYRVVADQQQLADRVLAESERLRDATNDIALRNRKETDFRIQERLHDLDFIKKEISETRKKVCLELEALETYQDRLFDYIKAIDENLLKISKKCILLRECRLGIDLTHDDVERELLKEVETIEGVQQILYRTLEQTKEQIRRIKAQFYIIDRDLEDKEEAIKLDYFISGLDEKNMNLSLYHGNKPLNMSPITLDEWNEYTQHNLSLVNKELNGATPLRSYIDTIITQCTKDLQTQVNATNAAFRRRIDEIKEAKTKLELQHSETVRMANEMTKNITKLEMALAKEEGFMALAHTRLGNRSQRPGVELCNDMVETQLVNETAMIAASTRQLQQQLAEAQASLRYLMRCQIQLEEDINVKMNSLKIDEVDCMTIRESMTVYAY